MSKKSFTTGMAGIILLMICLLAMGLTLTEISYAQKENKARIRVFYGGAFKGKLEPCG